MLTRSRLRRLLLLLSVALAFGSCRPVHAQLVSSPAGAGATLSCVGDRKVTWHDLSQKSHRRALDSWCRSVGAPVISEMPVHPEGDVRRLLVVDWNVHVGAGQVRELVAFLRARAADAPSDGVGVVLLLQEMYRSGETVPQWVAGLFKLPGRIAPPRGTPEVGHLAHELGMSVAYIPSMRNGDSALARDREDRGSAILSTEPLSAITAIELPMLKQRRIVVMATATPRGGHLAPLRVMTTHLDTLGPRGTQAKALAGYIAQLPPEPRLVMGGDLNALWGVKDETVRTLAGVMNMESCGEGRTHLFGRFDYIFSTLDAGARRTCETLENKFSSDHRPVLMTLH